MCSETPLDSDLYGFRPTRARRDDYKGVRNRIYYRKNSAATDKLKAAPDNMQILRDVVK